MFSYIGGVIDDIFKWLLSIGVFRSLFLVVGALHAKYSVGVLYPLRGRIIEGVI